MADETTINRGESGGSAGISEGGTPTETSTKEGTGTSGVGTGTSGTESTSTGSSGTGVTSGSSVTEKPGTGEGSSEESGKTEAGGAEKPSTEDGSGSEEGGWKPPDVDVTISDEIRRLLASRARQIQHVMRPSEYTVEQIKDIMYGIMYIPDPNVLDPSTGQPKEELFMAGLVQKIKDVAQRLQALCGQVITGMDSKTLSITADQITSLSVMYLKYSQQWNAFAEALDKKLNSPSGGGASTPVSGGGI